MEQQLLRDAVTQDNNITLEECTSSATYFSKCVDEVVITNTVRSFPNQKAWMNVRWGLSPESKKQVTMMHGCAPWQSKRQKEDISRDWRGTGIRSLWWLNWNGPNPNAPKRHVWKPGGPRGTVMMETEALSEWYKLFLLYHKHTGVDVCEKCDSHTEHI